jgi:holliday junction DNA helicase RuvA
MIALLDGVVAARETEAVILSVGGVGYRVFVARQTLEIGEQARLYISEVIREDKHDLYGFLSIDDKELFEILISVQGVGPKLGQKIMSAATSADLRQHIQTSDLGFFTSISGVGKKTAQKIILDLKGVLVNDDSQGALVRDDVTDALETLGYSKDDIQAVLPHVVGETSEDRVKSALRMLGKGR